MMPAFILVMGVAGSGKTTIGKLLAAKLGWDFYDADDFHSPENIAKMRDGVPLNDADRSPWLETLNKLIMTCIQGNKPGVLACSALKQHYRQILLLDCQDALTVYLKGSYDLIWSRMADRSYHYMKPSMLKSQFDALEEPVGALTIDISLPPEEIVELIIAQI